MNTGFGGGFLYVNSGASRSRDRLGNEVDVAGRIPVGEVVRLAKDQGLEGVTVENITGTLRVGRVAIRQEIEACGGYTKQRANQIIKHHQLAEKAPLVIADQPCWTVDQIRLVVEHHKTEARYNKRRFQERHKERSA